MDFQKHKKDVLSKIDKSKKGSIDGPIISLLDSINECEQYCTTSSCSGRIVLLHKGASKSKQGMAWILSSHSQVKKKEFRISLKKIPRKGEVWFLFEAPIMHIAASSLKAAFELIGYAHRAGFKRAGIISSTPLKSTVEIFGNSRIEMPICFNGKKRVSSEQLLFVLKDANAKMRRSHKAIDLLEQVIKSESKKERKE